MDPEAVRIRGFAPPDASFIRSLIAREGWNGGLQDPGTFAAADLDAWLIAEVDGRSAGVILATRWNDHFGWIGVYLVDPDLRGRGIGLALFRRALERLEPRTVGLDGDPAQRANYRRSGFVDVHAITRWRGRAGVWRPTVETVPAVEIPFEDLVSIDARAVGTERRALLRAWLDQLGAASVAVVADGVTALATARPADEGWKVGPVYAPDASTAAAAVAGAVAHLPADTVCWFDVAQTNGPAQDLFRDRGYEASPTSGRMSLGAPPPADVSVSFAVMAHEVG